MFGHPLSEEQIQSEFIPMQLEGGNTGWGFLSLNHSKLTKWNKELPVELNIGSEAQG